MEVVGAVASFIALGQGLQAGVKAVRFLREIPEIQQSYDELEIEIEFIQDMLQTSQEVANYSPNIPQHPFFLNAIRRLEEIRNDFAEIATECSHQTGRKIGKVRKTKWLRQENRIGKLHKRTSNAKGMLHFAISCQFGFSMQHGFIETKKGLESIVDQRVEDRVVYELPETTSERDEMSVEETALVDETTTEAKTQATESHHVLSTDVVRNTNNHREPLTRQMGTETLLTKLRCPKTCQCRCHFSRTELRLHPWLSALTGSGTLCYNAEPTFGRPKCSEPDCKRGGSLKLAMNYRFPMWLWRGALAVRASYDAFTGLQCSSSLRPSRTLPNNDVVWHVIEAGNIVDFFQNSLPYYPDDVDDEGESLIEYAIKVSRYESVRKMLEWWGDILTDGSFSSEVAFRAYDDLEMLSYLSDQEVYALNKVIEYSGGEHGLNTTVHWAAINGEGVRDALEEEPDALDSLNHFGYAPLQLAARLDNLEALNDLILAGADVDLRGCAEMTPLAFAALYDNERIVQRLLQAKSNVNLQNLAGFAPLHHAADGGSAEVVGMLMMAGASPASRAKDGDRPLHQLALSTGRDAQAARHKLQHLRNHPDFDLEAREGLGNTALFLALSVNNLPALRCLVDAGSALHTINDLSQNILHRAAGYSNIEVLEYLSSLALVDINLEQKDVDEYTSWDFFRWTITTPSWRLGGYRKPTADDQEAFVHLYQEVRDRNLEKDLYRLGNVLDYLYREDNAASRAALSPLIKQKQEWERFDLVSTLRAVDGYVRVGDWKSASAVICDLVQDISEELWIFQLGNISLDESEESDEWEESDG
ncbi:hypothetical protein FDECE_3402 [Fusarium decemcellulare]|nr:hypothetical protein FDECE_3402 [Fusarium decemcellulare]